MGLFGGKSKGDGGMAKAIDAQNRLFQQARADRALGRGKIALGTEISNPFGSVSSRYDPNKKKITSSSKGDQRLQDLYFNNISKLLNFDQVGENARNKAFEAYQKPVLQNLFSNLGNLTSRVGTAGLKNSGVRSDFLDSTKNLQEGAERRLFGLGEQAKSNALNQLMALSDQAYKPLALQAGVGGDALRSAQQAQNLMQQSYGSQASDAMNQGNSLANLFSQQAQMESRNRANRGQAIGSAIGGVAKLGSSFAGGGK